MDEATKERLKNIPKTKCAICDRPRSYTNPMAKCKICGKKFCYDHIRTKPEDDGVGDYCDACFSLI